MAWIELHQSLITHKKTRRLARALGLGVPDGIPQAVGHLCMFWLWCVDGAEGGELAGMDAQDIADAAGWTGDPETFLSAMVAAGFIDQGSDGAYRIHDWDDYIGKLLTIRAENREKERKRKQKYREKIRGQKAAEATESTEPEYLSAYIDQEWRRVVIAYEENIGLLPGGAAGQELVDYYEILKADVVIKAIEVTNKAQPENPWRYLKAVLAKWVKNEITTLEKAEAYTKDLERRLEAAKKRKQPTEQAEPPAVTGEFY